MDSHSPVIPRIWIGLDQVMGDCQHCIHQDECAPLKQHISQEYLNGNYRFRCPILIKVDENTVYAGSPKSEKGKVKK